MKKLILFIVIIFFGNSVFSQKADSVKYYKIQIKSLDSLLTAENAKKMVIRQMQYDFDKKMASIYAEQDKKDVMTFERIQELKIARVSLSTVLFLVILFACYLLYRLRKIKRQQ